MRKRKVSVLLAGPQTLRRAEIALASCHVGEQRERGVSEGYSERQKETRSCQIFAGS